MYLYSFDGFDDNNNIETQTFTKESKETIDYYKEKLKKAKNEEIKLRKKLKKLNFKSFQLSLLIDKKLESISKEAEGDKTKTKEQTQKGRKTPLQQLRFNSKVIPPLQASRSNSKEMINGEQTEPKGNDKFLESLLLSPEPEKLKRYMDSSSFVEDLFYTSVSIFDPSLIKALNHATPEMQIIFMDAIFERLHNISCYLDQLISLITEYSSHTKLVDFLTSPSPSTEDGDDFMTFYLATLNNLAKILNCDSLKIVYTDPKSETLLYPIKNFIQRIDVDDSLCGHIIHEQTSKEQEHENELSSTFIENPKADKHFEIVSEAVVFDENPVLCVTLNLGANRHALFIFSKAKGATFTTLEKSLIYGTLKFLIPTISMFSTAFTYISPFHFTRLTDCIRRLRTRTGDLFKSINEEACRLTSASFCRIVVVEGAEIDFPNLEILQPDNSFIRSAYESNTVHCIKNPRSVSGFSRSSDDCPQLQKIRSLLVVPVRTLPIVLALYNPTQSSSFTQIDITLIRLFTESLPPLLQQHKIYNQLQLTKQNQAEEIKILSEVPKVLEELTKLIGKDSFLTKFKEMIKCDQLSLFIFRDEFTVVKFPDDVLYETTDTMSGENPTVINEKDLMNIAVECNNDKEVNSLLCYPFYTNEFQKLVLIICSHDVDYFESIDFTISTEYNRSFVARDAKPHIEEMILAMIPLIPTHIMTCLLKQCSERVLETHECISKSDRYMSKVLDSEVKTTQDYETSHSQTAVTATSTDGKHQTIVTCSRRLNDKETDFLESYAEWLATNLSRPPKRKHVNEADDDNSEEKKEEEETDDEEIEQKCEVLIGSFTRSGLHDAFDCDIYHMSDFITWCYKHHSAPDNCQMIVNNCIALLQNITWRIWFTSEEKNVIMIITLLRGIVPNLVIVPDSETVENTKGLSANAVKYGSILFAANGPGHELDENKRLLLIQSLNDYSVGFTERDYSSLIGHIRMSSIDLFKPSDFNKQWVGRAITVLSQTLFLTGDPTYNSEDFALNKKDEQEQKTTLFFTERVILPLLTYLAQKNTTMMKMVSNVRETIKLIREQK